MLCCNIAKWVIQSPQLFPRQSIHFQVPEPQASYLSDGQYASIGPCCAFAQGLDAEMVILLASTRKLPFASCNSFHLYSFLRSSLLVDAWQGFRMSLRSPLIHRLRCSVGRRCRRRHNESELCEKGFNKEGSFHCCCEKKHFDFGLGGLAFEALLSRGVFPLFP